jgi:hypothetical protein
MTQSITIRKTHSQNNNMSLNKKYSNYLSQIITISEEVMGILLKSYSMNNSNKNGFQKAGKI